MIEAEGRLGATVAFDGQVLEDLTRIFDKVDTWMTRTLDEPTRPLRGSPLARDDQDTDPFQISHAVLGVLNSAVDHLHALRKLIIDANVVHARAPFTLLRAALENASIAVWLLAPSSRDERILRRLRLQWADVCDGMNAAELAGTPQRMTRQERRTQLEDVARARGFTPARVAQVAAGKVAFTTIVGTAAAEAASHQRDATLLVWKLCSGITHARTWAALGLLRHTEISRTAENVLNLRLSAPDSAVLVMTQAAALMIHDGWTLFDQRSTPLFG
ncbi:hypothetical protein [Kutzneria buriramensis]|uniref:Uncharacterized protein n=1 Tax=Kutzneria buriramensis TaxID=1045776 RepID=A0A3E0IAR5_9PSEU|nr:hypothetical protein [Kutzneria buriramensis]REH55235.1 hypothetical protein BCF44_101252 [Kutzneria buriramensis]